MPTVKGLRIGKWKLMQKRVYQKRPFVVYYLREYFDTMEKFEDVDVLDKIFKQCSISYEHEKYDTFQSSITLGKTFFTE